MSFRVFLFPPSSTVELPRTRNPFATFFPYVAFDDAWLFLVERLFEIWRSFASLPSLVSVSGAHVPTHTHTRLYTYRNVHAERFSHAWDSRQNELQHVGCIPADPTQRRAQIYRRRFCDYERQHVCFHLVPGYLCACKLKWKTAARFVEDLCTHSRTHRRPCVHIRSSICKRLG